MDPISERLDMVLREVLEGANTAYLVDILMDLPPADYDKLEQEVSALYLDLKDVIYAARGTTKPRAQGDGGYQAGYLPTPAKVDYNAAGLPPKGPIPRPLTMGEAEKGTDPRAPGGIGYDGAPGPGPGE
jgi:hypothetical protein